MDLQDTSAEWVQKCTCGKRFYQPNSYTNHINSCPRFRSGVGSKLEGAKLRWKDRKAQSKKGKAALNSWFGDDEDLGVDKSVLRPAPSRGPVPITDESIYGALDDPVASASDTRTMDSEPVPTPEPVQLGRGLRTRQATTRFKDFTLTSTIPFQIPSIPAQILGSPDDTDSDAESTDQNQVQEGRDQATNPPPTIPGSVFDHHSWKKTPKNPFGLYKRYWTAETAPHDPDFYASPRDQHDVVPDSTDSEIDGIQALYPFPNLNSFLLGEWFWRDGNEKSRDSFRDLLGIITSVDFRPDDLREANWNFINDVLASSEFDTEPQATLDWMGDGTSWRTATVQLDVPFNSTSLQPGLHHYEVPDFRYRPLVPIIQQRLEDASRSDQFHIVPTDLRWQPQDGGPDFRVYGEIYNSPAFINAFKEVQSLPPEPTESSLPRYVVALMFASDETMLTSFGSAKIWPVYMLFGNESKYRRAKPSLKLFEEIAYFQPLPDRFQDWYLKLSGKKNVSETLHTFLNRELFQEQWRILLDDDFVHAYRFGIVVDSFDGVRRRFYPRVLTYSADYPERAAIVSIRSNGEHPCPRCLVAGTDIHNMGTVIDGDTREQQRRKDDEDRKDKIEKARNIIYTENLSVNTKRVEALLKPTSLVPTRNAFSSRLSEFGLDIYRVVAVDILHEVEIGVWKSLFIQLLRLLEASSKSGLHTLNARFRDVPGFGRDTIRRFGNNVSEMKQFAARNYEDLLQCAIPTFEGLLSGDHDGRALDLLFTFAHWHSLAKLRLHTDATLDLLDDWTRILGDECRRFASETCKSFDTQELKREYEARKRNEARKKTKKKGKPNRSDTPAQGVVGINATETDVGRKSKSWNINTPKFHSLGDVASYIRTFGTTDSYSTQLSEHFHRFPKSRYRRTNKRKAQFQISRIQTRQTRIRKLRKNLIPSPEEGFLDADEISTLPYFIGKSQNQPLQLSRFLFVHSGDPAAKDFMTKLKQHLLPRVVEDLLREARSSPDEHSVALPILEDLVRDPKALTNAHLNHLFFHSERIYQHSIVQFNYTTYDCRRDQDTLNASTSRRDLMCFGWDSDEPLPLEADSEGGGNPSDPQTTASGKRFNYARLLGVFHANIIYLGPGTLDYKQRRFDFLWVRWFGCPDSPRSPTSSIWSSRRPEVVSLKPLRDPLACGFVDPSCVVRAAHIIPRYSSGKRYSPADHSTRIFSQWAGDKEEWKEYYVNPFADRDMTMRFHWGLGVGHAYSHGTAEDLEPEHPPSEGPMEIDDGTLSEGEPDPSQDVEGETDSDDSDYDRPHVEGDSSDGESDWEMAEDKFEFRGGDLGASDDEDSLL